MTSIIFVSYLTWKIKQIIVCFKDAMIMSKKGKKQLHSLIVLVAEFSVKQAFIFKLNCKVTIFGFVFFLGQDFVFRLKHSYMKYE